MRKYLYGIAVFVLAFVILSVSVLRCCSVISSAYDPKTPLTPPSASPTPVPEVVYNLAYSGGILPNNPLWYLKAARDRIQYFITTDKLKKADLALLFSDKRLSASLILLQKKNPDLAVSVLTKGEKYLEMASSDEVTARQAGLNTNDFLIKLATASLKHRQVIEEQILPLTPENLKPDVVKAEDYSKNTYKNCQSALSARGIAAPKDPFNGQ